MEDFDQAIEDTIIALNIGILRTRDGMIIKQSEGKSAIFFVSSRRVESMVLMTKCGFNVKNEQEPGRKSVFSNSGFLALKRNPLFQNGRKAFPLSLTSSEDLPWTFVIM